MMTTDRELTSLQPSAALVMRMSAPLYPDGIMHRFFTSLDLSSGTNLYNRCHNFCPWYDEVIANRKYLMHSRARRIIASSDKPCRLILPAAGMTPLPLHLVSEFVEDRLPEIIEMDIAGMDAKSKLYQNLIPEEYHRFSCSFCDITSIKELDRCIPAPDPSKLTILIFEGISYYITAEEIIRIMNHCIGRGMETVILIEYMQPCSEVLSEMRIYPKEIFRYIREECDISEVHPYRNDEIDAMIRSVGGEVIRHFSSKDMEELRSGKNVLFREDTEGWKWTCEAVVK